MIPFDVTLCLFLIASPQYQYGGGLANTEESYESIRWDDERPQPTWPELNTWWRANQAIVEPYYA